MNHRRIVLLTVSSIVKKLKKNYLLKSVINQQPNLEGQYDKRTIDFFMFAY